MTHLRTLVPWTWRARLRRLGSRRGAAMWSGFEHGMGSASRSWSMGRVLVLAVAAAALPASGASAQTPEKATALRLGSTPWSPFTGEPGHARVAIDLVHTALKRLGITVE